MNSKQIVVLTLGAIALLATGWQLNATLLPEASATTATPRAGGTTLTLGRVGDVATVFKDPQQRWFAWQSREGDLNVLWNSRVYQVARRQTFVPTTVVLTEGAIIYRSDKDEYKAWLPPTK